MQFLNLPVTRFLVCSEDEDVDVVDSTNFEKANDLLNKKRNENPDQVWSLVAEVDA